MALFPPEEVHFHLNEGGSPERVVSGPVRVKCIDYVSGGFLALLCIMFLCDFCRTAHFSHQPFLVFLVTDCATSCPLTSHNHAFYVHSNTKGCMFWVESEILRSITLSHFALREQANTLLFFDSFLLRVCRLYCFGVHWKNICRLVAEGLDLFILSIKLTYSSNN